MPFQPDFYNLWSELTDEEQIIWQTASDFVASEFLPIINRHYQEGSFPDELISKLGELGLLSAGLPEDAFGSGISPTGYGLIMQELEAGDSGLRSFASVQGGLVMYPIWRYGSKEQKALWLPKLASGQAVGCFGLTEPEAGSNPGAMKTRARKIKSGWEITGRKMWITNGSIADIAVVWAKDEDGIVRGFLVETDRAGFSAPIMHGKLSLRASVTSELLLERVQVPASNRLPGAEGLKAPLSCLTQARYSIAWGVIGAAMRCYTIALDYARDRRQFTRPIAGYQLTQKKLVDMLEEITKAQWLTFRLAQLKERGGLTFDQVSMAKRNNVAMARNVARSAREILGANGIMEDYEIMRHMANLETVYTYEGSHEMHTLIIGEKITGLKAFE